MKTLSELMDKKAVLVRYRSELASDIEAAVMADAGGTMSKIFALQYAMDGVERSLEEVETQIKKLEV